MIKRKMFAFHIFISTSEKEIEKRNKEYNNWVKFVQSLIRDLEVNTQLRFEIHSTNIGFNI